MLVSYFSIGIQVVVQDTGRDGQISIVKWVSVVPSLRPKLPPLSHTGVEVTQ